MIFSAERRSPQAPWRGFTLIELLVVIAIIGILAGFLFSGLGGASQQKIKGRIYSQMAEIETAINEYHAKRGSYPPSVPNGANRPSLYYELVGTVFTNGDYVTLDGQATNELKEVTSAFSTPLGKMEGFSNSGKSKTEAENFYPNLKRNSHSKPVNSPVEMLSVPVKSDAGLYLYWQYDSLNPTNNPGKYDLWVEWTEQGKTQVIGNWKR